MAKDEILAGFIPHGWERPNQPPDKTRDWPTFFKAQALVTDNENQVDIKTDPISPYGLMVIPAFQSEKPIANFGDLTVDQLKAHLSLVHQTMIAVMACAPSEANFYLYQTNMTDPNNIFIRQPSDLGTPKSDEQKKAELKISNSQTLGFLHSHVDALNISAFERITSLAELRHMGARLFGVDPNSYDERLEYFMRVRRPLLHPGIFPKLAHVIWENGLEKELLEKFPEFFSKNDKGVPANTPLPLNTLILSRGFEALKEPAFAEAAHLIHTRVLATWKVVADKIKNYKDGDKFPDLLKKYEGRIERLAKIVKLNPTKDDWRWHPKFNYTIGAYQAAKGEVIFFVDPQVTTASGTEATGIHVLRQALPPNPQFVRERIAYRARVIATLQGNPNLVLGPEGKYTLEQSAKL